MALRLVKFAVLLVLQCVGMSTSLSFDAADAKKRPVSKVIVLLKDMLKQLQKEAEADEEIYDKLACWCETNDKEKTKAIVEAEARIEQLTTKVEDLTAESSRLGTEIKNLEREVQDYQEALAKATALRQKQLAEFNAEEKELLESIAALKAAITVLAKHHGGAFLQMPRNHVAGVAATIDYQIQKHAALLQGVLTPSQRKTVASFVQTPQDFFDAPPTFKQSYAPQSGQIFGILRQMRETFEANLGDAQKDENTQQKEFEDVKAAKEAQIAAGQAQITSKTAEKTTTDADNAQAKTDIEDTKKSLSADEQFLMMLKNKCQMTDKEWAARQKTRQLEMEAVSKALAVLSGDDAHDLFTRTFNPSLVQAESAAHSERRNQASSLLSKVAHKYNNPRLVTLATQVKLDAFVRVKAAIDKMIAELLQEKEDEIKHRDFCNSELNSNLVATNKKNRERQDLEAQIAALKTKIAELTAAIETLETEIKELQTQLKKAGEDREKQNQEFQLTIADQRETQKLLTAALGVLQDFYGTPKNLNLAQQDPTVGPPPPPGFERYEKNAGSTGVINLIASIIRDAKAMEAETIRDEEDAQKAYEDFVIETNNSIESKTRDILNKKEAKAQAEGELVDAQKSLEEVMLDLEQLANYKAQLHQSCDFILNNFDLRQSARDEEVEALRQAKAILSGAKFQAFLQG